VAASIPHDLIARIRSLPQADRVALVRSLPQQLAQELLYAWPLWARPEQLPPPGKWLVWLILAGRGFGKTRCGAEWVISVARENIEAIAWRHATA
jgi:phage terminase large subunit-like protein